MMKQEIDMNELEQVVGGSVVINDRGKVNFTTLRKGFTLKNCTWRQARNYAEDLLDSHPQMTDKEFDEFVMGKFQEKGWI